MTSLEELAREEMEELPEELAQYFRGFSNTALTAFYAERHTTLSQAEVAEELGVSQPNVASAAATARRRLQRFLTPPESHVQRPLAEGGYDYPGNAWELPRGSTERRLTAGGEPPRFEATTKL